MSILHSGPFRPSISPTESAVWAPFSELYVRRADAGRMGFWRDEIPGVGNADYIGRLADDLLRLGDGSCRSWADLFHWRLATEGIESTVLAVRPKLSAVLPLGLPAFVVPDGRGGRTSLRTVGMMVAPFRWSTLPGTVAAENDRQIVNPFKYRWRLNHPAGADAIAWSLPDVEDLGRMAQGTDRAPGLFGNHAVVRVGGRWYDPSFGLGPFDSLSAYEDRLLGRGTATPGGLFSIVGWQKSPDGSRSEGLLLAAHPAPPGPVLEAVDVG